MRYSSSELANEVAYSCKELAEMGLPGFPTSRQGWDALAKKKGWVPIREVVSAGKAGKTRFYQPPPEVMALIKARQHGEVPSATAATAAASMRQMAGAQSVPLKVSEKPAEPYRTGVPHESIAGAALETECVARCIMAAERVLAKGYTRQQQVSLGIDTWGMLRRMFQERLHRLGAIPDADLEQLARFIYNARRAMEVARPDNIPPLV